MLQLLLIPIRLFQARVRQLRMPHQRIPFIRHQRARGAADQHLGRADPLDQEMGTDRIMAFRPMGLDRQMTVMETTVLTIRTVIILEASRSLVQTSNLLQIIRKLME